MVTLARVPGFGARHKAPLHMLVLYILIESSEKAWQVGIIYLPFTDKATEI